MTAQIWAITMFLAAGATPGWQGVLPEKSFDFAKVPILQTPTAGYRHAILVGATLPPGGVDVILKCSYHFDGEGWGYCRPREEIDESDNYPAAQGAASSRMGWTRIDMSRLSALRPVNFVTEVKVHVSPTDLVDLQPPPTGADAYTKNIVWAYQPPADRIGREYPDRAQRWEASGWAIVACRILEDLSPACVTVAVSEHDMGFERSAPRIVGLNRVEPKLTDGRSAVGAWIRTRVLFTPAS